ncbi:MAG: carbohydrate binding domain-containing protein [Sedimentisphaerales bacterium]|nr:carbohydrate binding domain-containing protein [Sedimentisphaerales bacterium]
MLHQNVKEKSQTNRRNIMLAVTILLQFPVILLLMNFNCEIASGAASENPGVVVLMVDTDRVMGKIDKGIYGQFLEHINHSVIDGLFSEQIRGQGFEGRDFQTHWESFANNGDVRIENVNFENGEKSLRLNVNNGTAGVRQGRIYLQDGFTYGGSVWLKPEQGSPNVTFKAKLADGNVIAEIPLKTNSSQWQEVSYSFSCTKTDTQASIEITATGSGTVLLDFISMMRADVRRNGMLRPDLLKALRDLKPSFIRWPGGSFASTYLWKDGIGAKVSRKYHPNVMWGGYADYYGFGTDEFLELCRQLDSEPLIVLAAPNTEPNAVQYAMDWVHYLNDPPTTELGKLRAANGHREPYNVKYIQIDNEPMNNGFTPETYAEIVNVYGSRIRKIAPDVKIVACGQKRSNDMQWSQKLIDIAGDNFDILGCHNYEYENENFQTGVMRIQDYLLKLRDYVRISKHPEIKIAVLEWSLCRTYDWRSGLHSAGSLIVYEKLSPELEMTCPALLMRNTTDNPEWRAFIYHDHVSWFPGSGYVVEKLFREHYAEKYLASSTGTFRDIRNRNTFFDDISQMKPEDWKPGTVDAIATGSDDVRRIVIKAVNYEGSRNTLLVRLQGKNMPQNAKVTIYSLTAGLMDAPSLENPNKIIPAVNTIPYSRNLTVVLEPYTVVVIEIAAE